jgi:CRISPR-associated protein Csb2
VSTLLISVRFHDGRYHGSGVWPPSPARLFQALVAAASSGGNLSVQAVEAFEWLEGLDAPIIAAPSAYAGQSLTNYVPNNDLDAVGGCLARIGEIRAPKIVRPHHFDAAVRLLYAWTFKDNPKSNGAAGTICEISGTVYQLGRGVDMAWAQGEIVDENQADRCFHAHDGIRWRPNAGGNGIVLPSPHPGSLVSLTTRFAAMRVRFKTITQGKKAALLFSQPPKPSFRQVCYNSPSTILLFDIRAADSFAAQPLAGTASLTEKIRDLAAGRLRASAWLLISTES